MSERDELADVLAYWFPDAGTGQALTRDEHLAAADALLPVVDRIARARAAAELRAAARDIRYTTVLGHIAERLDVRADDLDPS